MSVRALLVATLLAVPAAALAAEPQVKISLSSEDPDVHAGESDAGDMLEFHVWADGPMVRGGEFGLVIEGAEFLEFQRPPAAPWLVMPIPNGPPGTISQAIAGDCATSPVLFGTLRVKPDEAGGPVLVDVMPSEYSEYALILACDSSPLNGLRVFPAGVNISPEDVKPHRVVGEPASGGPVQGPEAPPPVPVPDGPPAPDPDED
jgi:hypothetical protein